MEELNSQTPYERVVLSSDYKAIAKESESIILNNGDFSDDYFQCLGLHYDDGIECAILTSFYCDVDSENIEMTEFPLSEGHIRALRDYLTSVLETKFKK